MTQTPDSELATHSLFKSAPATTTFEAEKGLRAPFAWYGGKAAHASWLLQHFPEHRVFIEPFGGAANVLLSKRRSDVEIYNDLDARLANFFRVLRDRSSFDELVRLATLTPYSRGEFVQLTLTDEPTEPVERAWWFFVRARQAFGGAGMTRLTACFWATSVRTRRHMAESVSKYLSAIDSLPAIADRFRTVLVESLPAVDLLAKYDATDAFFYCDPPYLPETRYLQKATVYGCEMTVEDHEQLLNAILPLRGKVMISGYPSELYDRVLEGWRKSTRAVKSQMGNSGEDRTEVIWMNYPE